MPSKCTCLPSPSSRPTKCDKASSTASTSVSVSEQYSCICLRSSSVVVEPFSLIRGCRVSSSPCLSFVFGFSYQSNKIAIFFPPFLDSFLLLPAGFAHAKCRLSLGRAWVFLTQRSVLPSAESLSKKDAHSCGSSSSYL